jgi:hypothetical protein
MGFNPAQLQARYTRTQTNELIRIVNYESQNYLPEVVELARLELQSRGVSLDDPMINQTVQSHVREDRLQRQAERDGPLNIFLKAFIFVSCGFIALVIIYVLNASGRKIAYRQAWAYFGYGWLFRVVAFLLVTIYIKLFYP